MPKVKYNGSKGLYQVSGQGVDFNGQVTMGNPSGSATQAQLDQPQFVTLCFMLDTDTFSTVAEHTLTAPNGSALNIPKDFCAISGHVEVTEAFTSGGSLTLLIGTGGTSDDPNGLLISKTKAQLAQWTVWETDGALLSGSSQGGGRKHKRFITTDDTVTATIGTAAATAGKAFVYIQGYQSPVAS